MTSNSSKVRCGVQGCTTRTGSRNRTCWKHRPAPTVAIDADRVIIGGDALVLNRSAARQLALDIADVLTGVRPAESEHRYTTRTDLG